MRPYKTITLRLNAAEYAHLKALSDTAGLKMEPALRELSAIGNNVNQIAHNTNAVKAVTQSEIDEAVRLVRKAWRLVKEAL